MKKIIIQFCFAWFVASVIFGCHEHENLIPHQPAPVSVGFDSTRIELREDADFGIITLSLDKPASKDGAVNLSVDTDLSRLTIEPAPVNGFIALNFLKNQQSGSIRVRPINNSLADGNQEITITIVSAATGIVPGPKKYLVLKLIDDESVSVQESVANFIPGDNTLTETMTAGLLLKVKLSRPLTEAGSVELTVGSTNAVYGIHYTTLPAVVNGKIDLTPTIGESVASITIVPIDNAIINGEFQITFSIANTAGNIVKGTELSKTVTISDDELADLPKGYEVNAGIWGLKKIYEYDQAGRIKYVHIEETTPGKRIHDETYFYDLSGRLEKINTYPQIDRVFSWSDNRIVKSETIDHGVVKGYVEYDYDEQGNVSGTANYFRQPNGQFKFEFMVAHLYFADGNLYKSLTYIPSEEPGNFTLISTKTYDGYSEKENPFAMIEILPTVKAQRNLPSVHILEENGMKLTYHLSYEYRSDGRVSKRTSSNGSAMETSTYLYY